MTADPPRDTWLYSRQAADLAGMSYDMWRHYVFKGYAPPADDPGDTSVEARSRRPRWRAGTVIDYRDQRKETL